MPQQISGLSASELEDFFLLLPRIFSDYRDCRRGPYRMAFIFGNTIDNEDSSFLRAVKLANAGMIQSLGISEGDLGHGYEGFDHSLQRLKAFGWGRKVPVVKLDVAGNLNTGSEAQKLAEHVRFYAGGEHRGNDLAVIAPPFHIVRAFMTIVTALKRNQVTLRVYAVPGVPLPWNEQATHSQGTLRNTRSNLLTSELERLEKYRAPEYGGMLSARKVIEYLNWRDS